MTQALYRKYRPKAWDEVMGQDHIVTTLKNAIVADRVAHAYLFAGSRGTGKTTLARLWRKQLIAQTLTPQSVHATSANTARQSIKIVLWI
jgi:DNA polymerase III subunit gamma/tau